MLIKKKANINHQGDIFTVLITITVGYAFLLLMPCLIGGLVDQLEFSTKQAGWVASAQMFGMMIGALCSYELIRRFNIHTLLLFCSGLIVLMDIFSGFTITLKSLVFFRLVSGIGAGMTTGVALSTISDMDQPERIFSMLLCFQFVFGAFGLAITPFILDMFGMSAIFFTLAGLSIVVIALILKYPFKSRTIRVIRKYDSKSLNLTVLLTLSSLLIMYIANNALWAYLDRIGVSNGLLVETVGMILGISMLSGIVGGVLAYFIEIKFGRAIPAGIGLTGMIVGTYLLTGQFSKTTFLISACLLNGSLSFTVVYYLGLCAHLDPSGLTLTLANFMIAAGVTLGPFMGTFIIGNNEYGNLFIVSFMGFIICFLMIEGAILTDKFAMKERE